MSAYVNALNRAASDDLDQSAAVRSDLRQCLMIWYADLPSVSRNRPFAMSEIEAALGTQGKYLSPILLSLGWQRKRRWSGAGQFNRYWLPPSADLPRSC